MKIARQGDTVTGRSARGVYRATVGGTYTERKTGVPKKLADVVETEAGWIAVLDTGGGGGSNQKRNAVGLASFLVRYGERIGEQPALPRLEERSAALARVEAKIDKLLAALGVVA